MYIHQCTFIINGLVAQVYLCELTNISKRLFKVPICLYISVLGVGSSIHTMNISVTLREGLQSIKGYRFWPLVAPNRVGLSVLYWYIAVNYCGPGELPSKVVLVVISHSCISWIFITLVIQRSIFTGYQIIIDLPRTNLPYHRNKQRYRHNFARFE